jgi:4-diphosphocytidyl-2-C-methyl-D-erythritol kinase
LLALNRLWGLHASLEQLMTIGLALGADVPFFLSGRHGWVEGIGEKITPLALPIAPFVVVKPDAGLDTKLIFSDPELKRDSETAIISGFATNTLTFGRNDLQAVAQRLCPGVSQAIRWLATQGLDGRMTGSGSAVFAHLLHAVDLQNAPVAMQVKLCSSLDVHPLLGWADSDS